jgi:hypothetical protein
MAERLSVSLNEESSKIINKYLTKYGGSKADLIRRALIYLNKCEEFQENVDFKTIEAYIDYLGKLEHVIVDIAHWKEIWNEIGQGSIRFWDEVFNIGVDHRKEYYDKGIRNIRNVLEHVEKTNWYKLSVDSEDCYTLILTVSEASKFVKTFLSGFFKYYPRKVEINEEGKKIRIRVI